MSTALIKTIDSFIQQSSRASKRCIHKHSSISFRPINQFYNVVQRKISSHTSYSTTVNRSHEYCRNQIIRKFQFANSSRYTIYVTHLTNSKNLTTMTRMSSNSKWSAKLVQFLMSLTLSFHVIAAHSQTDFRCSHVPPTPNQVTHVWLNAENFSASNGDSESELRTGMYEVRSQTGDEDSQDDGIETRNKSKRHIVNRREQNNSKHSVRGSLWDVLKPQHLDLKRLENLMSPDSDDLVPMRIQVYHDNSVYSLEQHKLDLITNTVIPSVIKFFESALSIRRNFTIDKFRITRRCPNNTIYYARDNMGLSKPYCMDRCEDYAICGEMLVPQDHLSACSYCNSTSKRCMTNYLTEGKGVSNAQLLLYVSSKQTSRCRKDQTIAYAAHCAQDAKTDRPVAGHVNICPDSISVDPKDLRALIATVKHELTHVLGFSVSLFAYYRDETGRPLTERDSNPGPIQIDPKTGYAKWSDKIIKRQIRPGWVTGAGSINKEVHLMVTPTVIREVRNHFNCSTLEGAELEDQGSDGTSMTHWEKRLFENEAMTGTHTQNSVYSRLTLAVLQDTGWYVANFSKAEKLEWGSNLGCNFAKKSCKSWIDERRALKLSIRPFCDQVKLKGDLLQISCTEDRTSKAVCNMKHYNDSLPQKYRNFDHLDGVMKENLAHYGGSVDLADYCPFIQEFTWQAQNVTIRGSRCDIGSNNLESEGNAALEYYGPQTRCFEHSRRWDQRSCIFKRHWHHYGAGCYKYTCSNGHVNVQVGNHSYPCYYPDQIVHIEQSVDQWLYNGTLICPACEKVCPSTKCKSFDKRLIDKILSLSHDMISTADSSQEESLRAFIDDTMNSIDTNLNHKLLIKQKSIEVGPNSTRENNRERLRYKEYLLQVLAQHRKPPRQKLLCSSASSLIVNQITISLFLALSIAILMITLPGPEIKSYEVGIASLSDQPQP